MQVFLLQIQLAKLALEGTRQRSWKLFQAQSRTRQVVSLTTLADHPDSTGARARPAASSAGPAALGVLDIMYRSAAPAPQGAGGPRAPRTSSSSGTATAALLGPSEERAVQQEMVNFVNNLHQCVVDRLLLNAWEELERVSGGWARRGTKEKDGDSS